jgi:hypothetical protein
MVELLKKARCFLASGLLLCPAVAAPAPVAFTVEPGGGSARIISRLQFRLCALRGFDPR